MITTEEGEYYRFEMSFEEFFKKILEKKDEYERIAFNRVSSIFGREIIRVNFSEEFRHIQVVFSESIVLGFSFRDHSKGYEVSLLIRNTESNRKIITKLRLIG